MVSVYYIVDRAQTSVRGGIDALISCSDTNLCKTFFKIPLPTFKMSLSLVRIIFSCVTHFLLIIKLWFYAVCTLFSSVWIMIFVKKKVVNCYLEFNSNREVITRGSRSSAKCLKRVRKRLSHGQQILENCKVVTQQKV